jgi:lipopolysaccharide/colanic/teichoic acid biosynthesis glycosyltransferase
MTRRDRTTAPILGLRSSPVGITRVAAIGRLSPLYVDEPRSAPSDRTLKHAFDRVGAALALVVVGPLILGLAMAVRLTSRGPAFYLQPRVGLDGQPFRMVKLRTMEVGADRARAELTAAVGSPCYFKLVDDPRVTPLGRFLRRWSVDELPQLWNVLVGDMSFVGPRPLPPDEVAAHEGEGTRRLLVRPGITGLWQVSGRSDLPWEEGVRLDLHYVDNWSLLLDARILWRTTAVVLRREGAY